MSKFSCRFGVGFSVQSLSASCFFVLFCFSFFLFSHCHFRVGFSVQSLSASCGVFYSLSVSYWFFCSVIVSFVLVFLISPCRFHAGFFSVQSLSVSRWFFCSVTVSFLLVFLFSHRQFQPDTQRADLRQCQFSHPWSFRANGVNPSMCAQAKIILSVFGASVWSDGASDSDPSSPPPCPPPPPPAHLHTHTPPLSRQRGRESSPIRSESISFTERRWLCGTPPLS